MKPVSGGQPERSVTAETERDILSYFWKGNNYLIYSLDPARDGIFNLYCVDLRDPTSGPINLTTTVTPGPTRVIAKLEGSADEMLVGPAWPLDVYRLHLGTREMTRVAQAPDKLVRKWLVDKNGIVRGLSIIDGLDIILRTRPDGQSKFRTIFGTDFRRSIDDLRIVDGNQIIQPNLAGDNALAPKGSVTSKEMIYAISNIGRNTRAVVRIDPQTGELEKCALYANGEYDVDELEVTGKRGVTSVKFVSWQNDRFCFDPAIKELYAAIARELNVPEEQVEIVGRDEAEERFVVVVSSDENPGECFLFNYKPGKRPTKRRLARRARKLEGRLSKTEYIRYETKDGLTIHGYLTTPRGHDSQRRLPLIVIPHGGPWVRNTWGFSARENREVQFFASRGYAVLQMNFRGSVGYGLKFWEAGFKQWGQLMQDDIDAGVLWAVNESKIADRERIAIVGESYGGYAALVAIAFPRDREFKYAAAVNRAGISDLFMRMNRFRKTPLYAQQCEMVGDPDADRDMLIAVSPALHADQIKTPVFVAHGKHDNDVDPDHSINLVAALYSQGAEVEYLPLDEAHIFQNEESKIEYYGKVEQFLEKHLGRGRRRGSYSRK